VGDLIQGRDPGDESDSLHARFALTQLVPVCPSCFCHLSSPFTYQPGRPDSRDTAFHPVTCRCGRLVMARFYVEQAQ
jgi:hypothetical protein